jgi:hypothetical protein
MIASCVTAKHAHVCHRWHVSLHSTGRQFPPERSSVLAQALIPELKPATHYPSNASTQAVADGQQHATGRCNWERLQSIITKEHAPKATPTAPDSHGTIAPKPYLRARKRRALAKLQNQHDSTAVEVSGGAACSSEGVIAGRLVAKSNEQAATSVVAMDCEMVGVGEGGGRSALARVCVVCLLHLLAVLRCTFVHACSAEDSHTQTHSS